MKVLQNLICLSLSLTLIFISCKKDEEFIPEKYAEETVLYPEEIAAYDGILLTIRDMIGVDITGVREIAVDATIAEFGRTALVNVGDVKLNNNLLVETSSNQYVSNLDRINYGLNGGAQNRWTIEGGNGFSAFNKVLTVRMPEKIAFEVAPAIISLSQDITLKVEEFPNHAQAIIWQLKDVEGNFIQKETTTNELTLTVAELKKLSPSENCLLKVAAYSMENWSNADKQYVFINQTVETAQVELR